jgi:hypothetical protein
LFYNAGVRTDWYSFVSTLLISVLLGCAGAGRGPVVTRIEDTDGEIRAELRDTGAILVERRQIASIDVQGKVVDTHGKLLGWIHKDTLLLAGGARVPIRTSAQGELYLSEEEQRAAGLEPVVARIDRNGVLQRTGALLLKGASGDRERRVVLFMLLLLQNRSQH